MNQVANQYNYDTFALSAIPQPETFAGPQVGQKMIDFSATRLDGTMAYLSDYLGQVIVLETGSITCPIYTDKTDEMNRLVGEYPEVAFLLLYTHEAHPGERIGHHCSFDDKVANANMMKPVINENREVLVDDIQGTAHATYGGFPNMLYLIDRDGTVLIRGHWSDPSTLAEALKRLRSQEALSGLRFKFRYPNPFKAFKTLRRGGWKSVFDGLLETPRFLFWHQRERKHGWA